MDGLLILQQMCILMLLVSIGYFYAKKKILTQDASQRISQIVVDVTNPCTIITTVLAGEITATHMEVMGGVVIAILVYAGLAVAGFILPAILGAKEWESRAYHLMTVYTNTGFIGIPLAKAILPANSMIFIIIFNIFNVIFFYTHGIIILGGIKKIEFKKIVNSGSILAVFALVIYWFDWKLPLIPANTIRHLGEANVFLSMLLLGASLAKYNIFEMMKGKRMWIYTFLRMIPLPLAAIGILYGLGLNAYMNMAYVLMVAMPAGNLPLIMSEKEGYPTANLSQGIVMTTVVSFLTVPFIMGLVVK